MAATRAARRTPSEFREMVFRGCGGLDFLCHRHLLPLDLTLPFATRSDTTPDRLLRCDSQTPGFIRLLRTAIGLSAIPRLISRFVLVQLIPPFTPLFLRHPTQSPFSERRVERPRLIGPGLRNG